MTFPNHQEKYNSKPVFSPEDLHSHQKSTGSGNIFRCPESIILCYSPGLMIYIKDTYEITENRLSGGTLYSLTETPVPVGVMGNFGFGAPVAVTLSEVLIAMGVKRIINIGVAGTLQKHIDIGDIVVCEKAIRDEGTSYHYLEPDTYAHPHSELTDRIKKTLDKNGTEYFTGPSWTTDAPYRETIAEVLKYQGEGVLTVEMEASALFALGKHRNIEVGAIFTISDSLADLRWRPEFQSDKTIKGLEAIFEVALNSLSGN
ncbi:MAG: nucleoside phosphorylase [Dehalococcoidales bacterium]|nr:nucleoside phosphorylase [Dehalococcoidales bacterium]